MIEFTADYGVYSQSSGSPKTIADLKNIERPSPGRHIFKQLKREPGICVPWEQKRAELPPITGDEQLVKKTWEMIDNMGYSFLWTNLTW